MANKVTRLFRKNREFPKINQDGTDEIRDLIKQIDQRLGVVEKTLKDLIEKQK